MLTSDVSIGLALAHSNGFPSGGKASVLAETVGMDCCGLLDQLARQVRPIKPRPSDAPGAGRA